MNPLNRCCRCRKFKSWKELVETHFVPDNEFGPEESEFTCMSCVVEHFKECDRC